MEPPLGGHHAVALLRERLVDSLAQVVGDPLAVQIAPLHHRTHVAGGVGAGGIPAGEALYVSGLGKVLEDDLLKIPCAASPLTSSIHTWISRMGR